MQAAAGNLKKVSLELGGKSPNVVFKDADLDTAIPGRRQRDLLQPRAVLLRRFAALRREIGLRPGGRGRRRARQENQSWVRDSNPTRRWDRWFHEEQLNRVCGYLESGFSEGAKAVAGGRKAGDRGYFVEPTVLVEHARKT